MVRSTTLLGCRNRLQTSRQMKVPGTRAHLPGTDVAGCSAKQGGQTMKI